MKEAALDPAIKKGTSIVGASHGTFMRRDRIRRWARAVQRGKWLLEGRINPHISATYPLEKMARALNAIARHKAIGRVPLAWQQVVCDRSRAVDQ